MAFGLCLCQCGWCNIKRFYHHFSGGSLCGHFDHFWSLNPLLSHEKKFKSWEDALASMPLSAFHPISTDLTVHCFVSQKAADRSFLIMGLPLLVTCRSHQLLNCWWWGWHNNLTGTRSQIRLFAADKSFLIMGLLVTPVVQLMMRWRRRMVSGTKMLKTGHTSETWGWYKWNKDTESDRSFLIIGRH